MKTLLTVQELDPPRKDSGVLSSVQLLSQGC